MTHSIAIPLHQSPSNPKKWKETSGGPGYLWHRKYEIPLGRVARTTRLKSSYIVVRNRLTSERKEMDTNRRGVVSPQVLPSKSSFEIWNSLLGCETRKVQEIGQGWKRYDGYLLALWCGIKKMVWTLTWLRSWVRFLWPAELRCIEHWLYIAGTLFRFVILLHVGCRNSRPLWAIFQTTIEKGLPCGLLLGFPCNCAPAEEKMVFFLSRWMLQFVRGWRGDTLYLFLCWIFENSWYLWLWDFFFDVFF